MKIVLAAKVARAKFFSKTLARFEKYHDKCINVDKFFPLKRVSNDRIM